MVRARKSEPPPAGYGTIQRIDLSGKDCAWAGVMIRLVAARASEQDVR